MGGSSEMPAILLGGRETAVPACRSLGRAGIPVIAIGGQRDPVRYSRYCSRYIEVDEGEEIESQWLEVLLTDLAPAVLIPVSDHGVELVAHNREALLAQGFLMLECGNGATLDMLDKNRAYEIAQDAGVPTPGFAIMRDPADIDSALERLTMPCGIKPLEGHLFRERTGLHDKVVPFDDEEEFARLAGPWLREGLGLMATEIIAGPDDRIVSLLTYMDENCEPLFTFTNRKLRQDPPHFGVGCYVRQEDEPEVVELGLRFLQAADFKAVAHVEFKRDPRDDRLKLIECNPRINLAIEQLIASGFDLPLLIYRRLCGQAPPQLGLKRSGLRLWHPVPDLRSMRVLRREGELTVWRWLRSLLHRQHFTVFAADDPWPSIVVNMQTVGDALGRRIRRLLKPRRRLTRA